MAICIKTKGFQRKTEVFCIVFLRINCYNTITAGTALHSWQAAAQGKSSIAHKGMLYAARIMALTAIDFLQKPELVNKAREELTETLNGETYPDPLPKDLKPEIW